MADKTLQDKAIKISGKDYVLVSDRIIYFNDNYANGSITTELISQPTDEMVVIKATVIPDIDKPERKFTDYSQARWGAGFINKTSAIENCSTSAVGRALAYMGIGVIDSVASVDEINKAQTQTQPVRYQQPDKTQALSKLLIRKGLVDQQDRLDATNAILKGEKLTMHNIDVLITTIEDMKPSEIQTLLKQTTSNN